MQKAPLLIFSLLLLFVVIIFQDQSNSSTDNLLTLIKSKLKKINRNWDIVLIKKSPLEGFYRANIRGGKVIYYSDTTGYFFEGDLFSISPNGIVNITDINAKKRRKDLLSKVDIESTIVYKPKGEVKAVIYVFMDVDCGACRDLHKQTTSMNKLGIEVRYLAYPRAGIDSETYQKMTTAWCSNKRKESIDELMINKYSPFNLCKNSPVSRHYELGELMGLKGTPGIILRDGTLLHGYRTAEKLAQELLIN
ncbi:thioredoxin fold domain-containing protein [Colwellia psychrerythraea]|uniref:Thiol:disulfide interchange protein n=1 Tax=Colwellia psychrerythraea TaxID=28229 RepID=A0A099KQ61_COLPS|nr:thioredoxin fold domain-containing protein [Colwellia psychrerythraea]KGJ92909.1 Thioredoxin-like fold-containing protein [Colwellia psychrerythraea]